MKSEDKLIKEIITGKAIPKSLGLIELEKNYTLLAEMVVRLIEKVRSLEDDVEKLNKVVAELMGKKKKK